MGHQRETFSEDDDIPDDDLDFLTSSSRGSNPFDPPLRRAPPAPRGTGIMGSGRGSSPSGSPPSRPDPSDIDWNRPDHTIATDLGIGTDDVSRMRRSLGVATHPRAPGDYAGVDWRRHDADISRDLGLNPSTVGAKRTRSGAGLSSGFGNVLSKDPRKDIDWGRADWSRTNQQVANDLGCSSATVSKKREELRSRSRTLSVTRR